MTGHGWEPNTNGGPLFLAAGQDFIDTMIVDQPWPAGTTSWIVIAGVSGHFADGVLSTDRTTFTYRVEAPGGDDGQRQRRLPVLVESSQRGDRHRRRPEMGTRRSAAEGLVQPHHHRTRDPVLRERAGRPRGTPHRQRQRRQSRTRRTVPADQYRGDRRKTPAANTSDPVQPTPSQTSAATNANQRSYQYWCALWLAECLRVTKPGGILCQFTDWRQLPATSDAIQAGG